MLLLVIVAVLAAVLGAATTLVLVCACVASVWAEQEER